MNIQDIISKTSKISLFVGSGISIPHPSNLPSGREYVELLLSKLIPECSDRQEILTAIGEITPLVRFEYLIELLSDYTHSMFASLFPLIHAKEYNYNHLLIASLNKLSHPVLTTNFESLIEYACDAIGNKIQPLIFAQDYSKLSIENSNVLLKLHGSFSRVLNGLENEDTFNSIKIILEGSNGIGVSVEEPVKEAYTRILKDYPIIYMGYSHSDSFDLNPIVLEVESKMPLITILYDATSAYEIYTYLEYKEQFVLDDSLITFFETIIEQKVRSAGNLIIIKGNPTKLLEDLLKLYDSPLPDKTLKISTVESADNWKKTISEIDIYEGNLVRFFILGSLFETYNYYDNALLCYQNALKLIPYESAESKKVFHPILLASIGSIRNTQSDYKKGFENCIEAHDKLFDDTSDLIKLKVYGELASSYSYYGNPNEALKNYSKAMHIAESLEKHSQYATLLVNQGRVHNLLGNYEKAEKILIKAIDMADKYGIIHIKAYSINEYSQVLLLKGEIEKAFDYTKKAFELGELLNKKEIMEVALTNFGSIFCVIKDFASARGFFEKSLVICLEIGKINDLAINYGNIGYTYNMVGDNINAFKFAFKDLYISRHINSYRINDAERNINTIELGLSQRKKLEKELISEFENDKEKNQWLIEF